MEPRPTGPERPGADAAQRHATSVPCLDVILSEGFPSAGVYLLSGPPGTGKTVMANQMCFGHVAAGGRAVYVTVLAESGEHLLNQQRGFGFFHEAAIADGLYYYSGYGTLAQQGLSGLQDLLWRVVRDQHATLLALDGLAAIAEVAASDVEYRTFLATVAAFVQGLGCTAILQDQGAGARAQSAQTMVDGVVELSRSVYRLRPIRELEVTKLRGSNFLPGRHSFTISAAGIAVYPRSESLIAVDQRALGAESDRVATGIEQLDAMLGGGLLGQSRTMLLGTPGSGKTLLGLHVLAAGVRGGEACLYFSFAENEAQALRLSEHFGLGLGEGDARRLFHVRWQSPREDLVDRLVQRLLTAVEETGANRLFIGSLGGLQEALLQPERASRLFLALFEELTARSVTTLFSVEQSTIVSPALELPLAEVTPAIETTILLRYVELQSQLYRLVSVLRMRGSQHDIAIREFRLTPHGIEVATTFRSAEAILTGVARPLPSDWSLRSAGDEAAPGSGA
jgi:circadian clock protein KaiC